MAAIGQERAPDTSAGIFIEFEQLQTNRIDDRIEVRFAVKGDSWAAAQRAGIRPTMIAEVLSKDRRSTIHRTPIVQRTGRFIVTVPVEHQAHSVRFALQHNRVNGFLRSGVGVGTLTARLGRDAIRRARPAAVRRAPTLAPQVREIAGRAVPACATFGKEAKACRAIVARSRLTANAVNDCGAYGKGHRLQCVRHAARSRGRISATIRACAGRFAHASERVECVRRASAARSEPASGIYSCGAHFKNDARALDCVARIAYARANSQGLVDACSSAFGAAQARLDCIGVGARAEVDIAPAILECTQAMPWQSSRKQCIEAAAASKADLTSAIGACHSHAVRPEVVLRCVRYASQGDAPAMASAINGCGRSAGDDSAFSSCVAQAASN